MYGYDSFAIELDDWLMAERRGGLYLISLLVDSRGTKKRPPLDLKEQSVKDYEEETKRYKTPGVGEWHAYISLEDYAIRGKGDVLFLCTPDMLYLVDKKTGVKHDIVRKRTS
jgi:hypothetical protein